MCSGLIRTLLLCALLIVAGCHTRELKPIPSERRPAEMTDAQVVTAIKAALQRRHWKIISEKPGLIEAHFINRSDISVTVDVTYNTSDVSILYVDSNGLGYEKDGGEENINKHYYRWINFLRGSIRAQLRHVRDEGSDADDPQD